jgi:hypothetical protein
MTSTPMTPIVVRAGQFVPLEKCVGLVHVFRLVSPEKHCVVRHVLTHQVIQITVVHVEMPVPLGKVAPLVYADVRQVRRSVEERASIPKQTWQTVVLVEIPVQGYRIVLLAFV